MASDDDAVQDREWHRLHDQITELLDRYGKKNAFGKGDYWLVDDNWGWKRHQLEFQNLDLFRAVVIKSLQSLLADFPEWDITVRVDVIGKEKMWPGMGLVISHDEIIDDLKREFLPPEFRTLLYDGARPPKKIDLSDKGYIFRRVLKQD
jgi:hypothetical protein